VHSENIAYISGGAIQVQGPAVSMLQVEDSTFENNAVAVRMDKEVDLTLRLNTGGFLIPNEAEGYVVPIWRVDDGPVFGIPWELCQSAAEFSRDAVGKGLPPSWPNLKCANFSYTGPDSSYSHVFSLTEGPHMLWTGIFVNVILGTKMF